MGKILPFKPKPKPVPKNPEPKCTCGKTSINECPRHGS